MPCTPFMHAYDRSLAMEGRVLEIMTSKNFLIEVWNMLQSYVTNYYLRIEQLDFNISIGSNIPIRIASHDIYFETCTLKVVGPEIYFWPLLIGRFKFNKIVKNNINFFYKTTYKIVKIILNVGKVKKEKKVIFSCF